MKRCPELQPLSREHHTALRLALDFRRVAETGGEAALFDACQRARETFDDALMPHFRIEEQLLLPRLEAAGASAAVARTLIEHRAIQRLIRELEIPDADTLARYADLLTAHVRFEERELFELAETLLGRDTLARILHQDESAAPV